VFGSIGSSSPVVWGGSFSFPYPFMRNSGQAFAVVGTADFSPVASTTVLDKSTRMRHQLHQV